MEKLTRDGSNIDLATIISKVSLVESTPRKWWINTCATLHVCLNREWFRNFKVVDVGENSSCETRLL